LDYWSRGRPWNRTMARGVVYGEGSRV
jgi:hypothetical protein